MSDVSFELRAGEVHALVGENGAGKSTLIRVFTGAVQPDSGRIEFEGRVLENCSPAQAKALGIAAIYQHPTLFPDLSVAENIGLREGRSSPAWRQIRREQRRTRARELLAQIGARIDPESIVGTLSMPERQMVEIACALGADAKVVIMDEPTASLPAQDVEALFRAVDGLRARNAGIIYISHRLEELPRIADRVTVLRDGRSIKTRTMAEVDRAELIHMMVGRELSAVFPKRDVQLGRMVLETRKLGCTAGAIHDIDLSVRAGEILGVAGLVGSGRTQLANTLFGLTPADRGEIVLNGEAREIRSPAAAIRLGLAYVPEDRPHHGVIPTMSISGNTSLASLGSISRAGFLDFARERTVAARFAARLGTKMSSIFAPVSSLSGGNQQKVALSRWLATSPRVLILDEPTQGIDVRAKAEVHRLMSDLAGEGLAIVMISSEMPEIMGMSDRIAVMSDGTIAAILDRGEATQEQVLALALGRNLTPGTAATSPLDK